MTGDLVTWETVKTILNLEDDRQELAEFLISSASAQLEKYAGRVLAARDVELFLSSNGGRTLTLPVYPVNVVESLTVSGEDVEYIIDKETGIIRFGSPAPEGFGNVLFIGNAGFDPVPADLQRACIDLVAVYLQRYAQSGGNVGIKSFSANGAITTQYETGLPLSVKEIIGKYMKEPRV